MLKVNLTLCDDDPSRSSTQDGPGMRQCNETGLDLTQLRSVESRFREVSPKHGTRGAATNKNVQYLIS